MSSPVVRCSPSLQAHSSLQLLSEATGKSLTSIIEPHKELLVDMIPPRKHLLKHQPINTQIALMVSSVHLMENNQLLHSFKGRVHILLQPQPKTVLCQPQHTGTQNIFSRGVCTCTVNSACFTVGGSVNESHSHIYISSDEV